GVGGWGRGPSGGGPEMEWGSAIAGTAGQALPETAMQFIPENERGIYSDKIVSLVRRRGPVKVRDIQGYIRGRLRSSEIKDILAQQVEAGEIKWTVEGYRTTKEPQ